MSIIIGSARIDENGRIIGGKSGDQTKKEVATQAYYMHPKGWFLLRPKSQTIAKKIAKAMNDACKNDSIGYDQGQRESIIPLFEMAKNIIKINKPCECDCSKLVQVCVWEATGKNPGNFTTANAIAVLSKMGLFEPPVEVLNDTVICTGDILCTKTKGHIVIVTSGEDRPIPKNESAKTKKQEIQITTTALRLRTNPTTESNVIKVLSSGTECEIIKKGFSGKGSKEWYKVKSKDSIGYVASEYLKKK